MDSCNAASLEVLSKIFKVFWCAAICFGSGHIQAETGSSATEQVAVTYFTEPTNASLYSPSGGLYGATPLTLYYQVPPNWDACVQLEALQAVWVSGVESEVALSACPENSHDQHYTFLRPDDSAAGADLDAWFAEKVEQLALVEDPVNLSKNPAQAAREEPPRGNLVTCSDHRPGVGGCL